MNVRPIQPLPNSREFQCNEMFFSTTDRKGVILSGNEVFKRVSGFTGEELFGRPHNIIRHPDMPRAAFALLWTNLKQGKPFAGYVKNMAKDGCFYWVFVVAVPAGDNRYLSVRFKPTTPLLDQIAALYREMLGAENLALAQGGRETDAVAAGLAVATAAVRQLDFAGYDLFSHSALNGEIKARDRQLAGAGLRLFPESLPGKDHGESLAALYALGVRTYAQVDGLFRQLDGLVDFNRTLLQNSATVLSMAGEFRTHALNVNLTSRQFGAEGVGVGVVAGFLNGYSRELTDGTMSLREQIAEVRQSAESIAAHVAIGRLQMEMLLCFQAEAAAHAGAADLEQIQILEECFLASTGEVRRALTRLREILPRLLGSHKALTQAALAIEMAQVTGLTESARIPRGETLRDMFADFRAKISSTRTDLDGLWEVIDRIGVLSGNGPRQVEAITAATKQMQAGIHDLSVARAGPPAPSGGSSARDET